MLNRVLGPAKAGVKTAVMFLLLILPEQLYSAPFQPLLSHALRKEAGSFRTHDLDPPEMMVTRDQSGDQRSLLSHLGTDVMELLIDAAV